MQRLIGKKWHLEKVYIYYTENYREIMAFEFTRVKFKDHYLYFPVNVKLAAVLFFGGMSY